MYDINDEEMFLKRDLFNVFYLSDLTLGSVVLGPAMFAKVRLQQYSQKSSSFSSSSSSSSSVSSSPKYYQKKYVLFVKGSGLTQWEKAIANPKEKVRQSS